MNKDDFFGKDINEITFDEMTKAVEENPDTEYFSSKSKKVNYEIQCDYGTLSDSKYSPSFRIVNWGEYKRYDLRHWYANGYPGKGITLTGKDRIHILANSSIFDYDDKRVSVPIEFHSNNINAKIYVRYLTLSSYTSKNDGVIWNKEIDMVDWGRGQKIDIRSWSSNYDRCSKGITMTMNELKNFIVLLDAAEEI